jgi:hypothetical protein
MPIRIGTKLLAFALVLGFYPSEAGAYDPNRDPNAPRRGVELPPAKRDLVFAMAGEFERLQPASTQRSELQLPHFLAPQPGPYLNGGNSNPAPTPSLSYPWGPQIDPWLSYGHPGWFPGWAYSSPRIPWWSLVPFTKRVKD